MGEDNNKQYARHAIVTDRPYLCAFLAFIVWTCGAQVYLVLNYFVFHSLQTSECARKKQIRQRQNLAHLSWLGSLMRNSGGGGGTLYTYRFNICYILKNRACTMFRTPMLSTLLSIELMPTQPNDRKLTVLVAYCTDLNHISN